LYHEQLTKITKLTFTVLPHFYLRTSRVWTPCPSGSRKRKAGRSDSIRSIGFGKDLGWNVQWLRVATRLQIRPNLGVSATFSSVWVSLSRP
jgi:hypothetical protein